MSILLGILIFDDVEKLRINLWLTTSIRKPFRITKILLLDSIAIDDKVTPRNAEPSMNWTFGGITIVCSFENENASDSILVKCEFDSNVIDENDLQFEKHCDPRISTFLEIKIDWSDEYENASDSILVKCEFDSNVIDESDSQNEKHLDPKISTVLGIKIDWSDEYENVSDSIRVKSEFDSKVIDKSELQYEKHFDPRISTLLGIKIDWSDEYENASDSIRVKCESDSNVIDESDLQSKKHFDSRISTRFPISTFDDLKSFLDHWSGERSNPVISGSALRECWIWARSLTISRQFSDVLDLAPYLWMGSIVIKSLTINSTSSYP
jgi:hypothetical protein